MIFRKLFFNIQHHHLYSFNVIINPSLIYGFQLFSQGYNMDNDIISWSFHSPVGGKGMGCIIILASWELHFTRENINIWCNILVVIYLILQVHVVWPRYRQGADQDAHVLVQDHHLLLHLLHPVGWLLAGLPTCVLPYHTRRHA